MATPNGLMVGQDRRRPDPRQQEFATGAPRQREGAMTPPVPTSPGAMAPDRQVQAMVPKVPGGGRNGLMVPRGTAAQEGSDPAPPASATTPAPVTMDREGNAVPGVSGRLHTLLQSDSPYIQRARTKAKQYANRRGLMNSSIAAGAGETAAIDAALPIAQADASIAAGERGMRSQEFQQFRSIRSQQLMQQPRARSRHRHARGRSGVVATAPGARPSCPAAHADRAARSRCRAAAGQPRDAAKHRGGRAGRRGSAPGGGPVPRFARGHEVPRVPVPGGPRRGPARHQRALQCPRQRDRAEHQYSGRRAQGSGRTTRRSCATRRWRRTASCSSTSRRGRRGRRPEPEEAEEEAQA